MGVSSRAAELFAESAAPPSRWYCGDPLCNGELLEDVPGALWNPASIETARATLVD